MDIYFHIDQFKKTFGTFSLGPISLNLNQHEYIVLLGPTGCGKTSLLHSIAGISGKGDGHIFINEQDINLLPPHKRRIGYVSQKAGLFPHLTVRQNISFGLKYQSITFGEREKRVDRFLDLFEIKGLSEQSADTLSGGEAKRVAMARSLIIEPRILLLDEPLGMLDHNSRKKMLDILKMVHNEIKTTTIHVTHDRHEAWGVAQTCAVMNHGKILQTGSASDLFRKPKTLFVADFLGGRNIFQASFENHSARLSWIEWPMKQSVSTAQGWIMLRPEQIRIVEEYNQYKVSGHIQSIRDSGEFMEIEVHINEIVVLTVHASLDDTAGIKAGEKIFLDWNDEALHPIMNE